MFVIVILFTRNICPNLLPYIRSRSTDGVHKLSIIGTNPQFTDEV